MKLFPILSTLMILSVLLTACGGGASSALAMSNQNRMTNPPISEDDTRVLVEGNNAFAVDLYQSLPRDGNLIYSPFSVSLALAMTYAGARENTETQMADVLHFDLGQTQLHPAFNALDLKLESAPTAENKDQQPFQLNIANAVWAEKTQSFQQDFLDAIALNYGAGIHLADFINNYEPARKEINNWVADETQNKIKDLLKEGTLDPLTRMVLVNAIYFKADWLSQFEKESTYEAPFHLLDGSAVNADMMNQGTFIPYVQGNGYQAIELPYVGETVAMDVIVPDEGNFAAFESSLSAESLNEILNAMQPASVQLGLPKFSFTTDFSLADQLKGLGMTDAFDVSLADFSGMTGAKDLFVSDVIHKAFVAVDEKGTEAAAATAVIMKATSAMQSDITLTVDRPFIFVIRDLPSGQILFMGRVVNPTLE